MSFVAIVLDLIATSQATSNWLRSSAASQSTVCCCAKWPLKPASADTMANIVKLVRLFLFELEHYVEKADLEYQFNELRKCAHRVISRSHHNYVALWHDPRSLQGTRSLDMALGDQCYTS